MIVGTLRVPFQLIFRLFLLLMMLLISYSTYLVYELYQITQALRALESNRFHMVDKAQELRRSSDDLTRFARMYVVTGDPKYLRHYEIVLDIRNGQVPRPVNYQAIYWDLLPQMRQLRHPSSHHSESLQASLQHLPLSERERQWLALSETNSNQLVTLERQAFMAMKGYFLDADGHYGEQGQPDQAQAIRLLHSTQYKKAKHDIMLPIDQFLVGLSTRLANEIQAQEAQQKRLMSSLPMMLSLNVLVLFLSFRTFSMRMQRHHNDLVESSLRDYLTGVHNRKYAMDFGLKLLSLNQRQHQQVAVILMDVDRFKSINDLHGHTAGDKVLKHLCQVLSERVRKADIFARYGGEEFIFILHNTHHAGACHYAEQLRLLVAESPCEFNEVRLHYTVSMGVALSQHKVDLECLISKADVALYQAKRKGRNRVECAPLPHANVGTPSRAANVLNAQSQFLSKNTPKSVL